ncbi:MAG TPA: tetratricopeptide repeat protein, partial [Nannocystis sp.]
VSPEAERHYQLAFELEAAGRYDEAQAEIELALEGGAGRDAKLLAAKLAILRDDLDAASRLLEPLSKDASDAPVLYNLGLIAQKRGRYNSARSRYLAALRADPNYHAARFNLALLTWNAGVKEEAKHHAQKYIDAVPNDAYAAQLRQLIFSPTTTPPADGGSLVTTTPAGSATAAAAAQRGG